jgi:phenylpropionate dioxygenase-like ring-hydroxylating dioxygenase large terminal subunit
MPLELLDDGPKPFVLLGEPIVVWKKSDGSLACLEDRCCHRTAKLSRGYLEDDNIVCGYHGWTYDSAGVCLKVPQRNDRPTPSRAVVRSYKVAEKYGYVWVALDEPLADIPHLPEDGHPGYRKIHQFYEPWKAGAFRLMENSFDTAHVAYVHRNSILQGVSKAGRISTKNSDPKSVMIYQGIKRHAYGFDTSTDPRPDGEQIQISAPKGAPREQNTYSNWFMPFARRTSLHYQNGLIHIFITCATPIDDETTMLVQWIYRNDTDAEVSPADVVAFDRIVINEDKYILESCESDVPLATQDGEELHMLTDRPSLMMRRMLTELLHAHGEVEQREEDGRMRRLARLHGIAAE